jgi:two-component system NarL family sensor kinase
MEASSKIRAAFFEAMFEASPLAIVVLDRDGRVSSWSPAAQRIFGWSESEVLGQRLPYVPDDKHGEFLAVLERELAGEFLDGIEIRCQRKDRTPIDIRLWTAPLRDASGRVTDVLGILEDVTDRQRAEAARRESDAQRDAVLQNLPVVLYRAQASGPSAGMWVSENVERLTGFPAARFTAEPSFWASRLHPEDRDEVFTAQESQESGLLAWLYRWQCADGTYRWFLDQACLRTGHGESPPEYVGTWFDITERKQAEILVHAQQDLALALASTSTLEEGLRCCLDTACEVALLDAGGFYLLDEQTGALDLRIHRGLSPAFVRSVAGYGPESPHAHLLMAGKPVYVAHRNLGLPLSEAEQQEALRFLAIIPVLNEGRALGCMIVASHVVDNISDTARDALEAISAQIGHAIVRLKTEEALRKSDERFRRLVANTDTGFVVIDDAGVVLEANEPYMRLAGRGRMEEIIGHSVIEWTVPEEREHNAAAVALCARQGQIQDFETVYRHKDGRQVHVLINAVVEQRVGATGIVSYCRDITERKETEAALVLQKNQLDAIRAVTMELTQTLELAPLLDLIHRRAVELVGVRSGVLYLWDEATQVLESSVRYGYFLDLPAARLRMGEGVAGAVAERRDGLLVNDFRTSPYLTPWSVDHTSDTAVLAEPLLYQGRLLGVISLSNIQMPERVFTRADQDLLQLFAAQAAIAIQNAELYQAADRERRTIETMADLARGLNTSLDLDTILQRVAEGARDLTGAELAHLALWDADTDAMVFRYGAGAGYEQYTNHRIEPGKGVGGKVLATGEPFRTANYAEEPRITKDYLAVTLSEGVVAELAVPIRIEGRTEGLLFVDNRSARPFTEHDERTLQQLADHAALAIRNARLHATAVRRAKQFATLNTVMRAMTTELDPLLAAQRILDAVEVLIPNAAVLLFDLPEGTQALRVVASVGLRDADGARSLSLRVGEGLAGIAAATGQPVVSTGVSWDARFVKRSWAAREGLVSGIVLPLVFSNRVTGTLAVFLRRLHTFPKEEVDVLQALASQSANTLENARLFEQVDLAREHLLDLTQRVVSAQEEERGRLSRELHDEAGQALTSLRISLGLIHDDLPTDAASLRQRLHDTMKLTESITDQLRFLAQALRPPGLEVAGLDSTLESLCREFHRRTHVPVEYAGAELPLVPDSVGIHLYRFLQEALTNVGKHAQAHRVRVALAYDSEMLSLSVEDDGVGFDVASKLGRKSQEGIGLIGMQERLDLLKGRLEITSQPGHGTRLLAKVPWRAAT